jgi:hypothetical protein
MHQSSQRDHQRGFACSTWALGYILVGGAFEEFVDESLVGFGLSGGEAAELGQQTGSNPNGNKLLRVPRFRASHAAGALHFFVR